MFYHELTDTYIQEGTDFELAGERFGASWLNQSTPEQKAAKHIRECTYEGTHGDDRYYFNSEERVRGVIRRVSIRRPQDMIDAMEANIARTNAQQYLISTDWYVTRMAEIGTEIPPEVQRERAAARTLLSSE